MVRGRWAPAAAATLTAALWFAGSEAQTEYQVTSTVDPTPGSPNSGDEITIHFEGPDTPQGRADVDAIKAAFDSAVANSADMKQKVIDAGNRFARTLVIFSTRDHPNVNTGSGRSGTSGISIDLGDMELNVLASHLSSNDATVGEITALVNSFLKSTLAHEIEHKKHPKSSNTDDPGNDPGPNPKGGSKTGPQVDDENTVLQQLGIGIKRNQYGYLGADFKKRLDFTVVATGHVISLDLSGLQNDRTKADKHFPSAESDVGTTVIENLPGGVCTGVSGEPPCYPAVCGAGTQDSDCDGVGSADNCPAVANPQGSDLDGDGVGDTCDNCYRVANPSQSDLNADGVGDACEAARVPGATPWGLGILAAVISVMSFAVLKRRLRTS